jgi:hypothetical protein
MIKLGENESFNHKTQLLTLVILAPTVIPNVNKWTGEEALRWITFAENYAAKNLIQIVQRLIFINADIGGVEVLKCFKKVASDKDIGLIIFMIFSN